MPRIAIINSSVADEDSAVRRRGVCAFAFMADYNNRIRHRMNTKTHRIGYRTRHWTEVYQLSSLFQAQRRSMRDTWIETPVATKNIGPRIAIILMVDRSGRITESYSDTISADRERWRV
jgi:hypothetical protein